MRQAVIVEGDNGTVPVQRKMGVSLMQRHIAPPCQYLLQCVDVNSVSLYDSDVGRENFETLRVLLWEKLLAQDLQDLTEIKETS